MKILTIIFSLAAFSAIVSHAHWMIMKRTSTPVTILKLEQWDLMQVRGEEHTNLQTFYTLKGCVTKLFELELNPDVRYICAAPGTDIYQTTSL